MNLQFYLEKLFASEKFHGFMKENPSAYFCSGFFLIDCEEKGNKIHIDYVIPETKKIFSFQLAPKGVPSVKGDVNTEGKNGVDIVPVEQVGENQKEGQIVLDKIADNIDFDFEEIEKMIIEKMEEEAGCHQAYPSIRRTGAKIQKILLSLQKIDGKNFLVGTVFISGLGMIKIKIDLAHQGCTPPHYVPSARTCKQAPKDFHGKSLQRARIKIVEFEKKSFFDMMKIVKK